MRGHRPNLSLVDTGVDIILDSGIRIQVKTARLDAKGIYNFNLARWNHTSKPHGLKDVDVVVLWATGTESFWIIPANIVCSMRNIRIRVNGNVSRGRKVAWDRDRYLNAWNIFDTLLKEAVGR